MRNRSVQASSASYPRHSARDRACCFSVDDLAVHPSARLAISASDGQEQHESQGVDLRFSDVLEEPPDEGARSESSTASWSIASEANVPPTIVRATPSVQLSVLGLLAGALRLASWMDRMLSVAVEAAQDMLNRLA